MKNLKDIIIEQSSIIPLIEKLNVNSKSKVHSVLNNDTEIYDGLIGDNWKYDYASGGRVDMRILFPKIDKQYLKDHPCTPDELNYGIKDQRGEKTWEEWQQKCNRIAKIIETWPAHIIAKRASMEGKKADVKLLPGFVDQHDFRIHTNRNGKKAEIGIYDSNNHGITFVFKRK